MAAGDLTYVIAKFSSLPYLRCYLEHLLKSKNSKYMIFNKKSIKMCTWALALYPLSITLYPNASRGKEAVIHNDSGSLKSCIIWLPVPPVL